MTDPNRENGIRIRRALESAGILRERENDTGRITPNSQVVLERRYLSKDREGNVVEDTPEMWRRVAHNLSLPELDHGADEQRRQEVEDEFHRVMRRLEFLPNSPTLMNAGRELQQLSACFVLPVEDSLEDIFEAVKRTALIHKSGGGTGFSFSRLRPEGDVVGSTGGVASGPVSFINAFDTGTDVVKQGSTRRGANMGILRADHPDILKFIRAKADGTKLQNFNVSVAVTHDFMERARDGRDYDLVNPRTGESVGQLNAREVFREIVELAWRTGDPGMIFLDRINADNPNPHLGEIESTNPCFAGDVRLSTGHGMLTFRELHERGIPIQVTTDNRVESMLEPVTAGGAVATAPKLRKGTRLRDAKPVFVTRREWPVFRLETRHGYQVVATADHRFFTPDGPKALEDLEPGDEILIQSGNGVWSRDYNLPPFTPNPRLKNKITRGEANPPGKWTRELGELLGWITADGWITRHNKGSRTVGLMFGNEPKMALAPRFRTLIREWFGVNGSTTERHGTLSLLYGGSPAQFVESLGMGGENSPAKEVPESLWSAPREAVTGYLSALFGADGTVNVSAHGASCAIRLASSSPELLRQTQLLLLNEGIVGKIYFRRQGGEKELPGPDRQPKVYSVKDQYELVIDGESRNTFVKKIGFLIPEKQEAVLEWINGRGKPQKQEPFTDRVKSVTPYGAEDVYCTTEPETHSIIANGFVTAQCGEQMLLSNESCNLGSVNLALAVRPGKHGALEVDYDHLARVTRTAVRMLDNVIDANRYPIPAIEEATRLTRRIGVGVMGWSDLLVQLGIRYDSEEALELARKVMGFLREETHRASQELARERGAYPALEGSTYSEPMRNTAPTTIAPTGTISIIAGASSGIEPLFALAYARNVMDRTRLVESNPYFEAVARSEGFHSPELMEQLAETGSLEELDVPAWIKEVFRVSHQVAPEWHVRMQAAFQEHTDNAVSKTVNLPVEATPGDVERAYLLAWEMNCKGITVYRDGSKAEQVLTAGTREETAAAVQFPDRERERPRVMTGRTQRFRTGHGNMYVTVNLDEEGRPFEVFCNLGKAGGCDSAQLEAISRMTSLALRYGVPPDRIARQLEGITCCPAWDEGRQIRSAVDAMALALMDAPERENPNRRPKCPDCNSPVEFKEGCEACSNPACGWNLCG